MNKEIKKTVALLDEKEKKNAETILKADREITKAREKLAALNSDLEKADNADTYKTLLQDIRDYEAVIKFLEKQRSEAESAILNREEYAQIVSTVNAAFASVKSEQGEMIKAEIDKLTVLFDTFDNDVSELNRLLKRAAKLANNTTPTFLNAQNAPITSADNRFYIEAYYKAKNARELLKKGLRI